jgi:hypothetical protein
MLKPSARREGVRATAQRRARMRTLRLALITALLFHALCAGSTVLAASTGSIVGTVTSSEGGKSIAGAVISAASPSGSFHGRSDAKGEFTILGVVLDTYTVSVQAQGYQAYTVQGVTVTSDEATRLTAILAPANHLRTIGVVRARSITSAYQPDQTVDRSSTRRS